MTESMKDTIKSLNDLLSRNQDASNGFVEVANNVNYPNLTQWLIDWAKIHKSFAEELKFLIIANGGEVNDGTTMLAELHHVWVDLKAQWTNNDTAGLLDECLRGENTALSDYTEVIAVKVMPDSVRSVLNRQQKEIKRATQDLEFLKKSYSQMEEKIV